MLARVLEPEVLDTAEEAHGYDAMDHAEANRRFVTDFLACRPRVERVLDVCTGPGRIPIELCQRREDAQVVAVDYARHMLALAQRHVEAARLAGRIRLQRADAKKMPFRDRSFTAVLCNGSLHHIPEPRAALREMLRVVARGGWLFLRDLMRPHDDGEVEYLVATYAGTATDAQRAMFEASLRASLTVEEIREWIEEMGLYGDAVQATSDRHWTLAARIT